MSRGQITVAQQAAEKLTTSMGPTVAAEELINSIAPADSMTMITGPYITADQACRANIH
jgi:hypothetical protein